MDTYYEKLIIDVFTTTCSLPETEKFTFNQFYLTHHEAILKHFHIDSPTKDEVDLILDIFNNPTNDYLGIKNITYEMSKVLSYEEIKDYTFMSICPIISSAIEKYRLLNKYRNATGIVVISIENVTKKDLTGFKGNYFIISDGKGGWDVFSKSLSNLFRYDERSEECLRSSNKVRLSHLGYFTSPFEASDYCETRDFRMKVLKIGAGVLVGCGLGFLVYGNTE